jgi:hypothetical protein
MFYSGVGGVPKVLHVRKVLIITQTYLKKFSSIAIQKEYDALNKNGTWKVVDPPFGTRPIGCKWVYKKSTNQVAHLKSIRRSLW